MIDLYEHRWMIGILCVAASASGGMPENLALQKGHKSLPFLGKQGVVE
ncbi:MAG: hypothetical protein AAFR17_11630 [Pseudomonadota bacterium]